MGKFKENARYNVISVRVSDEEKDLLNKFRRKKRKSMADVVRDLIFKNLPVVTP